MKTIVFATPLALAALVGCASSSSSGEAGNTADATEVVSDSGTIVWRTVEGGFYVIETDGGKTYDPINLPAEYRAKGLRVRFEAKVRSDLMSTHMAGTLVEITSIHELEGG